MRSKSLYKGIVLLAAISLHLAGYAQKPAQYIRLGREAMDRGNYAEAEGFFSQAWLLDSSSFDLAVDYAEAARMIKDYPLAGKLYNRIWTKDGGKLLPEGLFWLATMEKYQGLYPAADAHFRKYAKKNKKKGNYFHDKAVQEAEACAWAMAYRQVEDTLTWSVLPPSVNSTESENAGRITNETFFFSRYILSDPPGWKIMQINWQDGVAGESKELSVSAAGSGFANLSPGREEEVFFTLCNESGECGIYQARMDTDGLKDIRAVDQLNTPGAQTTMPCYTRINGFDYLFFVSDREGGEGKMDIWFSRRTGDQWDEPVNAGERINTRDDELSPFYSDGVLYFSSDWHVGFGGQDVFRIVGSPGMWGTPENLGKPINSHRNDFFYSVYPDTGACFVSSDREGSAAGSTYSSCCNDLFAGRFNQETEETETRFADLDELNRFLPVKLYFHNDEPNPDSRDTSTQLTYTDAYRSYMNLSDTYLSERTKGLSGQRREEAELEVEGFFRQYVEQGKNDLEMFSELLYRELKEGKRVQVSIRGYASPRAKSDYNENLTKRRISSLINELSVRESEKFRPFIEGRQLTFRALPFGEYKADMKVSDDLANERESVYSLGARLERRIEIESVEIIAPPAKAEFQIGSAMHDFGRINARNGIVRHSFLVSNTGGEELRIDSLVASCGCTEPQMDKLILQPGEEAELRVGFDPFGKKGDEVKYVTIYLHGEEPRLVEIRAYVE